MLANALAYVNKYTFLPNIHWIINICEVSTVEKTSLYFK